MHFLNTQIPFVNAIKHKILVGFILGLLLAFIIIFLEPFDTNTYETKYKNVILSGFGVLFFITFFTYSSIESLFYRRFHKIWNVSYEIIATLLFFIVSGTVIYLYNHGFINDAAYSVKSYLLYFKHIVLVFIPIFSPIFIYLRHTFGELVIPKPKNTIEITGENKNETLTLHKNDLLYIKAVENYIAISFVNAHNCVETRTFRQTLSKAHQQLPFLEKCHRSYLLNTEKIENITGNSQNAKIVFSNIDQTIPLSKTYYTKMKSRLTFA